MQTLWKTLKLGGGLRHTISRCLLPLTRAYCSHIHTIHCFHRATPIRLHSPTVNSNTWREGASLTAHVVLPLVSDWRPTFLFRRPEARLAGRIFICYFLVYFIVSYPFYISCHVCYIDILALVLLFQSQAHIRKFAHVPPAIILRSRWPCINQTNRGHLCRRRR